MLVTPSTRRPGETPRLRRAVDSASRDLDVGSDYADRSLCDRRGYNWRAALGVLTSLTSAVSLAHYKGCRKLR